jgi:P-type Cu+ transporter
VVVNKIDNYTETQVKTTCYHCGELCADDRVDLDNKAFCCTGCKLVYEVLKDNDLCNYYDLENQPGQTIHEHQLGSRFSYLDEDLIL